MQAGETLPVSSLFPLSTIEEEVFKKKIKKKTVILSFKVLFLKEHRERTVSCLTVLLLCFFSKVFLQKEQDFLHTLIQRVNVPRQSTVVRRGASIFCYRKCTVLDGHRLFSSVQFSETLR